MSEGSYHPRSFQGSLLALIPRVAALSVYMGGALTVEEVIEDLYSLYLDSALSAHDSTLRLVEGYAGSKECYLAQTILVSLRSY